MSRLLIILHFFLLLPALSLADITKPSGQETPPVTVPPPSVETPVAVPGQVPAPNPILVKDSPDETALLPAASPSNPDEAFARALTAYNAGAIEDARREFLAIVEAGKLSAPLAHNLGNIEFRRGNPGQAVLWYKRALAIQPFSPETLQNLRTVRRQTGFVTFDPWVLSLSHLKPRQVENAAILTAWTAGLLIVWLVWLTPRPGRRWPLATLLILLLPVLSLGVFLTWKRHTDPHPLHKRQIVSNKETSAYAAPAEASSSVITLPSGSEVVPIETRGNWLYCVIPGGADDKPLRGWIRSVKLEPLWPYTGGI